MAMSADRADETLADALNNPATPHVWLHTGSPGDDGTANVAEVSTDPVDRQAVTFGTPENHPTNTERRCLSTSSPEWSGEEIDASQEITHFSIWSAATDGQVEFIAALSESKTTGSDGANFAEGDLEVAIEVFAKPSS